MYRDTSMNRERDMDMNTDKDMGRDTHTDRDRVTDRNMDITWRGPWTGPQKGTRQRRG
jgi:hypothetical protein